MKQHKIICYILVMAMLAGLLIGCKKQNDQPSVPATDPNTTTEGTANTQGTEATKVTEATHATETTPTQTTEATTVTEATQPTETQAPCIHVLGTKWTVTEKATCTNEGSRYKTCTLCGDKVAEVIPQQDHEPGAWKQVTGKEATCKQEGQQYQACRQCDEVLIYVNTEKKAHIPDSTGEKCKVCNEVIPKVETTPTTPSTTPTNPSTTPTTSGTATNPSAATTPKS